MNNACAVEILYTINIFLNITINKTNDAVPIKYNKIACNLVLILNFLNISISLIDKIIVNIYYLQINLFVLINLLILLLLKILLVF